MIFRKLAHNSRGASWPPGFGSHAPGVGLVILATIAVMGIGCASGEIEEVESPEEINEENQSPHNQSENQNAGINDDDNDESPLERGSHYSLSSGGGDGESENYRSRVSIGTPAPAGIGQTENYTVKMGMGPLVVDGAQ